MQAVFAGATTHFTHKVREKAPSLGAAMRARLSYNPSLLSPHNRPRCLSVQVNVIHASDAEKIPCYRLLSPAGKILNPDDEPDVI